MHTLPARARLFAASLAAIAGFVDAVGFIFSGGYFVSFMSGNTTSFAVRLAHWSAGAAVSIAIILLFVLGVIGGSLLARRLPVAHRGRMLLLIAALTGSVPLLALLNAGLGAIIPLPIAMGAMNTVFERNGEAPFGVTYMTGALVKAGQHLATAITGGARWGWIPYLLLWSGLVSGAILGALSFQAVGLNALCLPTLALALLARTRLH